MPHRLRRLLVLVPLSSAAVAATATAAPQPSAAINALNALRAQNGIPAGIVENTTWSRMCALHNAYELANNTLSHEEDPSRPGYSPGGSWAGAHSVLARGTRPSMVDLFASAPLHMVQLLSPELRQVGVAVTGSYTCVTTWPGYDEKRYRSSRERIYTFPGDGAKDVSPRETVDELPFTPGKFVDIPAGVSTGPNLFAYAEGSWSGWTVTVAAVSLVGPEGAVPTRSIDRLTPVVGDYLPPGAAIVMPVRPLSPLTRYKATITLRDSAGHSLTQTWSFITTS